MKIFELHIGGMVLIVARRRVWDRIKNFLRLKTTIAKDRGELSYFDYRGEYSDGEKA